MRFFNGKSCWAVSALFFVYFGTFFYASPARAAMTWDATGVIDSSNIASSTRVLWDPLLDQFATGYTSNDGASLFFSTSTNGSVWATPIQVLSAGSGLPAAETFFTTKWAGGTDYIFIGMTAGVRYYVSSAGGGSSWSTASIVSPSNFTTGNVQTDVSGKTYIAGHTSNISHNLDLFKTSSAPDADAFVTTTIFSAPFFSFAPRTDFALSGSNLAVSMLKFGTDAPYVEISSDSGDTWGNTQVDAGSDASFLRPRVKYDGSGNLYMVYVAANNDTCTTGCHIMLASFNGVSWTLEQVDTVGGFDIYAQHDLAFINGTTPVIVYYNKATGTLRYATKDSRGQGCDGTAASAWTCGNVATGFTQAPAVSIAAHGPYAMIAYQLNTGSFKSAFGTWVSDASESVGTAFPKTDPPKHPHIVVNGGQKISNTLDVSVEVSADNASEVALSTNPDFYNAAWQELAGKKTIHLDNKSGAQHVYAKFTNPSGGISEVVFDDITYSGGQIQSAPVMTQPVVMLDTTTPPVTPPAPSIPQQTPVVNNGYAYFVVGDGVNPFSSESNSGATSGTSSEGERLSCPERSNAFTAGGDIIRDAKGHLFVLLKSQHVACPVASYVVAQTWGKSVHRGSADGYVISSSLPYRPGSIIQNAKTRERYFVNTKGGLHKFPNATQFGKLGYSKNRIMIDQPAAIMSYHMSAVLTRNDIHPDGTLFLLDAKKREYGILQNRTLHPISYKTVIKFKENAARAVKLLPGETYTVGVRWD